MVTYLKLVDVGCPVEWISWCVEPFDTSIFFQRISVWILYNGICPTTIFNCTLGCLTKLGKVHKTFLSSFNFSKPHWKDSYVNKVSLLHFLYKDVIWGWWVTLTQSQESIWLEISERTLSVNTQKWLAMSLILRWRSKSETILHHCSTYIATNVIDPILPTIVYKGPWFWSIITIISTCLTGWAFIDWHPSQVWSCIN